MQEKLNRRQFVKSGAAAGVALAMAPNILRGKDDRKVRLGFIGVGSQGTGLLRMCLTMDDVEVPAVCDIDQEALLRAVDLVEKSGRKKPTGYGNGEEDYKNLVVRDDLDGVFIATPWLWHTPMSVAAMRAGKYCAPEVWGASSIEECWELIDASEETGMPCMMLENHCYDRSNMAALKMVRAGLFGEITHTECGYRHDLRTYKFKPGVEFGPGAQGEARWRTKHSIKRNGDLYPTHGLGPIANCLDDNRGNRMVSLTSTASKARSLHEHIVRTAGEDHPNAKIKWNLGDIVITVIKCQRGETITIFHDTNSPRPYSNNYVVQGTKGLWMEHRDLTNAIYIEGKSPAHKWEKMEDYLPEWEHPLWAKFINEGVRGGHGGAGFLKSRAFVECVKRKIPTPIDVYDTAAWIVVTPLSEQSIATGSAPVEFPDFTRGRWMTNKPIFGLTGEY
ncbi:Gfo/Idh/MocA family oxidoreductase [candidate division KSB1 bacterium]|nr:Gfo/Idh/MocA family oxidoreductase [candidate division KSB1 bacterium]